MEIKHNLCGDIKTGIESPKVKQDFLIELEIIMMKYKVDMVNVAWRKFNITRFTDEFVNDEIV